jgi:hypothetical protein
LLVIAVLVQLPLLLNPGYFSHDELTWGSRAAVDGVAKLPWVAWDDLAVFQYQPLTFNLWLLVTHALHAHPVPFHALWVLLGASMALGVRHALRRIGIGEAVAASAALVFVLNPYAVYVHGWVATLADLIWTGCGLTFALWLLRAPAQRPAWSVVAGWIVIATTALLAKEAALVLAPLAWLAWLLSARTRTWLWAAFGLTLPTLTYLALRARTILFAPRDDGTYGWSLVMVPLRWLEYQLFPFLPTVLEVEAALHSSPVRMAAASLVALALLIVAFRASQRTGTAYAVGGAIALGPVLLLNLPYNQYGYGYSLLATVALAYAWHRSANVGRAVLAIAALLNCWHGINVQRELVRVGRIQSTFSAELEQALHLHPAPILRLAPERAEDTWIYRRLSREPLAYGLNDGAQVVIVAADAQADWHVAADGTLRPAPPGQ